MSDADVQSFREQLERIERALKEAALQPKVVRIEEAARLLSCSPRHISRMAKRRKVRFVFPLGLKRVSMAEIARLTSSPDDSAPPSTLSALTRDAKSMGDEIRARAKRRRKEG